MNENQRERVQKLHEAYHARIRKFACDIAGPDAADDVAQETWLKVEKALGGVRDREHVETWLFRIARNAALDHLRRTRTRQRAEQNAAPAPHTPNPAASVISHEMHSCIRDLMRTLPESYATPLILREIEGMPIARIAAVLDATPGAVKTRLSRARSLLRSRFESHCTFYRNEHGELMCEPR